MRNYLLLLVLATTPLFAQNTFQKAFGEKSDETLYALCSTVDSGFAFVGGTSSYGDKKHVYFVEADSSGHLLWSFVYGGEDNDIARDVMQTKDGGFIIVGNTTSWGAGRKDVYVLKLNKKGEVEWSYTYGGQFHDYGFSVLQTLDEGYLIAGETTSFNSQSSDVYLLKLDKSGKLEWSRAYGGENADYAFKILEQEDGFVFAGETNSFGAGSWDVFITKINKVGDVQWFKTYGGEKDDYAYDLIHTKDEGYAIVGSTISFGMGDRDFYMIKTDRKGDIEWGSTYGEKFFDQCHGIIEMEDGYILSGISNSHNGIEYAEDVYVMRLNEKGKLWWSKIFGGNFGDYGLDILKINNKEFIIGGETNSFNGRDDADMYVIKSEDNVKLNACEHSYVTTIRIKQQFESHHHDQKHRELESIQTEVETTKREVLTTESIICEDNNQVIRSSERAEE